MNDKIHHTIKSIGKSFTLEEWTEWCKKHSDVDCSKRIAFCYDGYEWNDYDVCITPTALDIDEHTRVTIGALKEDEWYYGFWALSFIKPCSIFGEAYKCKADAELAGLKHLAKSLEESVEWYSKCDDVKAYENALRASLKATMQQIRERTFKQLTLF